MKRMTFNFISTLIGLLVYLIQFYEGDKLVGKWYAEELSLSTIEFYKTDGDNYFGKIIQSKQEDKVGSVPFKAYQYNFEKNTYKGTISPASIPFDLSGEITFIDQNTIKIVGKKAFIKKTFILKRTL